MQNQPKDKEENRTAIETLVRLIEDAFEGDPSHSLVANLHDLPFEQWTQLPPGGVRSVADILEHVGWAKWMYTDYAFGNATLAGDQPPLIPAGGERSRPANQLLVWLREGHQNWLAAVRSLADDGELDRPRLTNWGERLPARTIIRILIAHDFYHAGEINHLRALLQADDQWEYD